MDKPVFLCRLKVNVVDTTAAGIQLNGMYSIFGCLEPLLTAGLTSVLLSPHLLLLEPVSRREAQVSIPWKDELILE